MLLPSIFGENLFDDWMDLPKWNDFGEIDKKLYGKDDSYEIVIDLPGFKKEELTISLENGYLSVAASKGLDKDEKNKKGRIIRQERYAGSMQRSFFVGENVTQEDVKAKFEDGVLKLTVPKKEAKKLPESKTIAIEG